MKLTKDYLINTVATKLGCLPFLAEVYVDTLLEAISKAIVEGEKVKINGFGSFLARRIERNSVCHSNNSKKITIGSKRGVRFRPGKNLKNY
ncbi:MAG: HU family DNA-binding protein [Acidobacteriota bacterium]